MDAVMMGQFIAQLRKEQKKAVTKEQDYEA